MWKATQYNTTKVTIELRDLINDGVKLWDFDYPSYYKDDMKKAFEQKVIDHYYFRQIGQETVGRFLHCFRTKVREIMPRYLEMYKTVEIMNNLDNPFDNVDFVETYQGATTGSSSGSQSSNGSSTDVVDSSSNTKHRFSNTPQGAIDNVEHYITEGSIDDVSTAGMNTSQSEGQSSQESSNEGTNTYTLTKKGNQGVNTYAHDMIEFRQAIIDVDMMIINDLNELFLGTY